VLVRVLSETDEHTGPRAPRDRRGRRWWCGEFRPTRRDGPGRDRRGGPAPRAAAGKGAGQAGGRGRRGGGQVRRTRAWRRYAGAGART